MLICPLEGFGTVTIPNQGIRLDNCANLAFFGAQLKYPTSVMAERSTRS